MHLFLFKKKAFCFVFILLLTSLGKVASQPMPHVMQEETSQSLSVMKKAPQCPKDCAQRLFLGELAIDLSCFLLLLIPLTKSLIAIFKEEKSFSDAMLDPWAYTLACGLLAGLLPLFARIVLLKYIAVEAEALTLCYNKCISKKRWLTDGLVYPSLIGGILVIGGIVAFIAKDPLAIIITFFFALPLMPYLNFLICLTTKLLLYLKVPLVIKK